MGANVLLLFNSRHTKNYEKRERENGCSLFSLWYVAPSPSSSLVFHKRIGQEWLEYHRLLEFVVVRKSTRRELKLNQQQEKVERERASKCIPCLLFLSTADESVCVCLCLLFPLTVSCRHRRFSLKKDTKRNVKAFLYSVVCVRDQNKREREREGRECRFLWRLCSFSSLSFPLSLSSSFTWLTLGFTSCSRIKIDFLLLSDWRRKGSHWVCVSLVHLPSTACLLLLPFCRYTRTALMCIHCLWCKMWHWVLSPDFSSCLSCCNQWRKTQWGKK